MYSYGYYVLCNGPNCEAFSKIPTFEVFFGKNIGISPPGMQFLGFHPTVMQMILKIKHQGLTLMYFLWFNMCYLMAQTGRILA